MVCQKCGKDAGESKFCPECGVSITAQSEESTTTQNSKKKKLLIPIIAVATIIIVIIGIILGTSKKIEVDYADEVAFEAALNSGEEVTGKTVSFVAHSLHPDSLLGYNIWSGEHLNFISDKNPGVKEGQTVIAKVIDYSTKLGGSWFINYELLEIRETEAADTQPAVIDNRTQSAEQFSEQKTIAATTTKAPIIVSDKDFSVKSYSYENSLGDTIYFLVIKNNSPYTVSIDINGIAKDTNNNILGAADTEVEVLGPSEETLTYFYFDSVKGVDSVDCKYTYDTDPSYAPCIGNLSVQQTINEKNVVVSVTNNGETPAEWVEAHALFFDETGKLIRHEYNYVIDDDNEIKSRDTIVKQLTCPYGSFATVSVYLTGRADK